MNGACHAVLGHHASQHSSHPPDETLCGRVTVDVNALPLAGAGRPLQLVNDTRQIARAMAEPCSPDCGTCAAVSLSSNRRGKSLAAFLSERRRPLLVRQHFAGLDLVVIELTAASSSCPPRGPPRSVSA
jgi:hypothetical protein